MVSTEVLNGISSINFVVDEEEQDVSIPTAVEQAVASVVVSVGNLPKEGEEKSTGSDDEEWEVLSTNTNTIASNNSSDNNDDDATENSSFLLLSGSSFPSLSASLSSPMHKSCSSPDFRQIKKVISVASSADSTSSSSWVGLGIPAPPSITSASTPNKISFRDAILAASTPLVPSPGQQQQQQQQPKKKSKPRIIVTPTKKGNYPRCSSTPDLRSLGIIAEETAQRRRRWSPYDNDPAATEEEEKYGGGGFGGGMGGDENYDDNDICGDTDAAEYYQSKSYGYRGRKNGLKERPDEAKRRQMIVKKKDLQQQKNSSSKNKQQQKQKQKNQKKQNNNNNHQKQRQKGAKERR